MNSLRKRVKAGGKTAAGIAATLGKNAAKQAALAADTMLMKLGEAAKQRQRARKVKAGLKKAGKVALVLGAGAVTAYAGKRMLDRANGRSRRGR